MAKDLKVGELVPIYYGSIRVGFINKMGIITEILGYKASVLIDGAVESWTISDLKKMKAHKRNAATWP